MLSHLDHRLLWRVLAVVATVVVAASANLARADGWMLQLWGSPPPRASLLPYDGCGDQEGAEALRFDKAAGIGAEVVYSQQRLEPGAEYEVELNLKAPIGAPEVWVDVALRKDGPYYESALVKAVRVQSTSWQKVVMRGHYTSLAPGALRLGVHAGAGAVCIGRTMVRRVNSEPMPSVWRPVPATFFGIHLNKLGRHNAWPSFNPGILRMWSTATTWPELQPEPGEIAWSRNLHAQRLDYFVQHVRRQWGAPGMVMTLGMTPAWAGDGRVDGTACQQSYWGKGSCLPPVDLTVWRDYVRQLAERYRGSPLRYWELWNEADVSTHWVGGAPLMVELARVAREELRKVSTENVLIGPNVTSMGMRFLHDFFMAGGGQYIDAVSVHVYMGRDGEGAHAMLLNFQSLLRMHGLDLPIWNTESNTACGGGPAADRLLEQAACRVSAEDVLAQSVLMHAASGIHNFSFYTWEGAELDVGGVGLVSQDFDAVTPAGQLMWRLRELMTGAKVRWVDAPDPRLRLVELEQGGSRCQIFWSRQTEGLYVTPNMNGAVHRIDGELVTRTESKQVWVSTMPQVVCDGGRAPW